jgi:hypothetical protein
VKSDINSVKVHPQLGSNAHPSSGWCTDGCCSTLGRDFFWNMVFPIVPSCSHHFLNGLIIMFSICSSGSQCVPNSTTLYHITFTKSSPLVTCKDIIEEKTTIIYVSTLGVPKDRSIFLGWCTNQRGLSPKTMNKTLEVPTTNQYEPH